MPGKGLLCVARCQSPAICVCFAISHLASFLLSFLLFAPRSSLFGRTISSILVVASCIKVCPDLALSFIFLPRSTIILHSPSATRFSLLLSTTETAPSTSHRTLFTSPAPLAPRISSLLTLQWRLDSLSVLKTLPSLLIRRRRRPLLHVPAHTQAWLRTALPLTLRRARARNPTRRSTRCANTRPRSRT